MRSWIVWAGPMGIGLGIIAVGTVAHGQDAGAPATDTDAVEGADTDTDAPVSEAPEPACPPGSNPLGEACVSLPTFTLIEAGPVSMGSPDGEPYRQKDEVVRQVEVEAFELSVHEVTQGQFELIIGDNPSAACGQPVDVELPVACVSWHDAIRFCNALSEQTGRTPVYAVEGGIVVRDEEADGYRLPTEAEWERAARVDPGAVLAGGDLPEAVAWFRGNADGMPHPVGALRPTGAGVHDLSGNVSEWVWDGYAKDPSKAEVAELDVVPVRVQKGGSFLDGPGLLRVASRDFDRAERTASTVGFRVVRPAGDGAGAPAAPTEATEPDAP